MFKCTHVKGEAGEETGGIHPISRGIRPCYSRQLYLLQSVIISPLCPLSIQCSKWKLLIGGEEWKRGEVWTKGDGEGDSLPLIQHHIRSIPASTPALLSNNTNLTSRLPPPRAKSIIKVKSITGCRCSRWTMIAKLSDSETVDRTFSHLDTHTHCSHASVVMDGLHAAVLYEWACRIILTRLNHFIVSAFNCVLISVYLPTPAWVVINGIYDFVRLCPRFKMKTARAISTKLGARMLYDRTSACVDPEVNMLKVKVIWLWSVLLPLICMSMCLPRFLVFCSLDCIKMAAKTSLHVTPHLSTSLLVRVEQSFRLVSPVVCMFILCTVQ